MADIQLVIRIPKAYYELVLERCKDPVLLNAFKNGTPIPKGHGDLKDAKAILDKFDDTYNSKVGIVPDNLAEGFVQCEKLIKTATTLVKADKTESEDKE